MAWSGAASHRLATDPLSSPGLHRALCNEKAAVHARFVGGQVQRVNMGSSSFKRHSHRRRDRCNACLPHHCAPSVRRASSRIEGVLGRAMNAAALLGRGRAGLGLPRSGSSPRASGLLATFVALRKSANGTKQKSFGLLRQSASLPGRGPATGRNPLVSTRTGDLLHTPWRRRGVDPWAQQSCRVGKIVRGTPHPNPLPAIARRRRA